MATDIFDVTPSCLGFGCASLGSRIAARPGLRALADAFDAGVNWFDVAPAYGAGEAEALLARFLAERRDEVIVTTKVGLAPPARLAAVKMLYALGRPFVGAASGLRRSFRRASGTRNRALALDGASIESSVEASLRRLGTDRVDVLALHDPAPEDVGREEVRRALERIVQRGQARYVAVAGSAAACAAAARIGPPYTLLQMSAAAHRGADVPATSQFRVVHSVLGVDGARDRLAATLEADQARLGLLRESGYAGRPAAVATNLLLDAALAANRAGVVLLSMFQPHHRATALARAATDRADAPDLLRRLLGEGSLSS